MNPISFKFSEKEKTIIQKRIIKYTKIDEKTGCWIWVGGKRNKNQNYGVLFFNKRSAYAHRLSYEVFIGPIENGLDCCHTCDREECVNPGHIWIGTHQENLIDCVIKKRHHQAKKTHCIRGHEFTKKNTVIKFRNDRNGNIERSCKKCRISDQRRRYHESDGRIKQNKYRAKKRALLKSERIRDVRFTIQHE